MDNTLVQRAALIVLLRRLQGDIARRDGDAAANTIRSIRAAAGDDYATHVVDTLMTAAVQRIA